MAPRTAASASAPWAAICSGVPVIGTIAWYW